MDEPISAPGLSFEEYVRVVLRRKKTILFSMVVFLIIGALVLFLSPKVYEVRTTIEIGETSNNGVKEIIESQAQISQKLRNDVYQREVWKELGLLETDAPRITINSPFSTNLVSISVKTSDVTFGQAYLSRINEQIIKSHDNLIESQQEVLRGDIELDGKDIDAIKQRIDREQAKIDGMKKEQAFLQEKIAILTRLPLYTQQPETQFTIADLYQQIEKTTQDIELAQSNVLVLTQNINGKEGAINRLEKEIEDLRGTVIAEEPTNPITPVSPRLVLIALSSFSGGLLFGLFAAFARDWWLRTMKKRE